MAHLRVIAFMLQFFVLNVEDQYTYSISMISLIFIFAPRYIKIKTSKILDRSLGRMQINRCSIYSVLEVFVIVNHIRMS